MSNPVFISTSADGYGLISRREQSNNNPPESSQTLYTQPEVTYKLPQTQTYGLINTSLDGYGLIKKENQCQNNPSQTTGNSKVVIQPQYVTYAGAGLAVQTKAYSTI